MKLHLFPRLGRSVALIMLFITTFTAFSQESLYLGNEPDISTQELLVIANDMNFSDQAFQVIYEDQKNTYYALKNSGAGDLYTRVRILEQVARHDRLVSIGGTPNTDYCLFLTNNHRYPDAQETLVIMNQLINDVANDADQLSAQDKEDWLNSNNKYKVKN